MKDGKPIEGFRYYKGVPDSIGKWLAAFPALPRLVCAILR
jgi:hypothetical protein